MSLINLAVGQPEEFARLVKRLRELGVASLTETAIALGEAPRERVPPSAPREVPPLDEEARRHATMFAATAVRPMLPRKPSTDSDAPRHVVQRREGVKATHGARHSG